VRNSVFYNSKGVQLLAKRDPSLLDGKSRFTFDKRQGTQHVRKHHKHAQNNINTIINVYYIFQSYTFLICKNMEKMKIADLCIMTKSALN
jgi:hypothetical protein